MQHNILKNVFKKNSKDVGM